MIDSVRVLRPDVAAGDRGIDAAPRLRLRRLGDLDRQRRLAGRHVDEDVARLRSRRAPRRRPRNTSRTSFGIADDREDHVGRFGDAARRVGPRRALVEQRLGLRPGAVVDRGGDSRRRSGGRTSSGPSRRCRSSRSAFSRARFRVSFAQVTPSLIPSPWRGRARRPALRGRMPPRAALATPVDQQRLGDSTRCSARKLDAASSSRIAAIDRRRFTRQMQAWFAESLGESQSQCRAAPHFAGDAEYDGRVAVADIPSRPLVVPRRRRLLEFVSLVDYAIFRSTAARAPAVVGKAELQRKVERRADLHRSDRRRRS